MIDLPLAIRPFRSTDQAFVVGSWVASYVENGIRDPYVRVSDLKSALRRLIPGWLRRWQTLVATPANDPDLIAGWICGYGQTLHYVYVRYSMRRLGIAAALAAAAGYDPTKPITVSHLTAAYRGGTHAKYDPYAIQLSTEGEK